VHGLALHICTNAFLLLVLCSADTPSPSESTKSFNPSFVDSLVAFETKGLYWRALVVLQSNYIDYTAPITNLAQALTPTDKHFMMLSSGTEIPSFMNSHFQSSPSSLFTWATYQDYTRLQPRSQCDFSHNLPYASSSIHHVSSHLAISACTSSNSTEEAFSHPQCHQRNRYREEDRVRSGMLKRR